MRKLNDPEQQEQQQESKKTLEVGNNLIFISETSDLTRMKSIYK